jgi:hypothetical protein
MNPAQNSDLVYLTLATLLVLPIVLFLFFLFTVQNALCRVSPRNRLMEPGMVWLMLIPGFNIIWQFFIATRVPGSLRNEFRDRNRDDGSDYGKGIGLARSILDIVGIAIVNVNGFTGEFPTIGGIEIGGILWLLILLVYLVRFALLIVLWVRFAKYSNRLAQDDGGPRDWERKFDDNDDGYGRRGPRADSPRLPPDAIKEGDTGRYE